MVELDISGIDAFLGEIDLAQRSFNNQISKMYRRWVQTIFYDIIELTPQWSGNLAANWRVSTTGSAESEQTISAKGTMWPLALYQEPHKRGDAEAVQISKDRFNDADFGYSEQVFIYNPTEIAPDVESQSIYIRGVNLLDGRVAMVAYAQAKYSVFSPQL